VRRTRVPFPALERPSGAFVTLRENGELRGCVGYIDAVKPLLTTVEEASIRAAFEDPRFEPLRPAELARLELEVSVLSPLRRITDASEIDIGTHGIVVETRTVRGVLLPQVAVECGWDRATFLAQTFRKAGLAPGRRTAVTISVFTAEVFGEARHGVTRTA
jgi:AmmeMemoRadiSam system protein A